MKIDSKDLFHGAALTQIVEHQSFKALNKAEDEKYGHYQVNHNVRLLIKHSAKPGSPWQFTFAPDDLSTLIADIATNATTFVVLVCGKSTVCLLTRKQFTRLIDLHAESQQWIKVKVPPGGSLHVTGSQADLLTTVAHNIFPKKIFI